MSHRELFDQACELASAYRDTLPSRPVHARDSLAQLRAALAGPLPEQGVPPAQVIDELVRGADGGLIGMAGPRYFGFVIGGSSPVSVAADMLTSAWDQNSGLYAVSPAQSVAEEVAAGWLLDLLGLPETASVGLTTGCQMAHFTALAAARNEVLRRAGWDVEQEGLNGAPAINLVAGEEVHVTIPRALRFLGLGARQLLRVPADAQGRMRPDALQRVLSALRGPTIVCAQAGNVNSGAFDPLDEIAGLAHAQGAWLHVDGAFGLWAAAASNPELRQLVRGAELADSWATDAHKWLNVPYDSGLVIVAHSAAHRASMTADAAYLVKAAGGAVSTGVLRRGSGAPAGTGDKPLGSAAAAAWIESLQPPRDAVDWTPEFSRRARAFTIYAQLRALGRSGVAALVDRCCALARRIADKLAAQPGIHVLNEVVLNQVLVRFEPPGGGDADAFTRAVIARVQEDGTCWLGGTVWHGMAAMRISISGESTREADIDASAEAIVRSAGELSAAR